MTLEQLKELLSTYGANDQERNAPVLFDLGGDNLIEIAEGKVEWDFDDGSAVILRAVAS